MTTQQHQWQIQYARRQRSTLPTWLQCHGCHKDVTVVVTRERSFLACRCCNAPQASGCQHGRG